MRETFVVYRARIEDSQHPTKCTKTEDCRDCTKCTLGMALELLALGDAFRRQEPAYETHAISARLINICCWNAHQINVSNQGECKEQQAQHDAR